MTSGISHIYIAANTAECVCTADCSNLYYAMKNQKFRSTVTLKINFDCNSPVWC